MSRIHQKAHIFLDAYEHMNNVFEKQFGYSLYFIGGTLLGFIRENDFLENDKDMDISYFSKYKDVKDVRKEILEIMNTLVDSGEDLYFIRNDYSIVKNYFKWRVDERDRIDVMPTWCQAGMIYRPTFVAHKGDENLILPLQKEKFYGYDVYIPNKPEEKLANVYGDDWRIPNRKFNKRTRRNENTQKIVSTALLFGKDVWPIIKKTGQWKEELKFSEKIFIYLLSLKKYEKLARLVPERKRYKKRFFKWLKKTVKRGEK